MTQNQIVQERLKVFNDLEGPRVGDLIISDRYFAKLAYKNGDKWYTAAMGSFNLSEKGVTFSGHFDAEIDEGFIDPHPLKQQAFGEVWYIDPGSHRVVKTTIPFRMYELINGAKLPDKINWNKLEDVDYTKNQTGMYIISKEFHFSAAHQLNGLPEEHPCSRLHGHNYKVIVGLRSDKLNSVGMVQDYRELSDIKTYIDNQLDHRNLNEVLPIQPTAENLAYFLYWKFKKQYPMLYSVSVKETDKTSATYVNL